jgi:hypothetical protein
MFFFFFCFSPYKLIFHDLTANILISIGGYSDL